MLLLKKLFYCNFTQFNLDLILFNLWNVAVQFLSRQYTCHAKTWTSVMWWFLDACKWCQSQIFLLFFSLIFEVKVLVPTQSEYIDTYMCAKD